MTINPEDLKEIKETLIAPLYEHTGINFSDPRACHKLATDVNRVVQQIYQQYNIRLVDEDLMKATGQKMYFQGLGGDLVFSWAN